MLKIKLQIQYRIDGLPLSALSAMHCLDENNGSSLSQKISSLKAENLAET
jgi:hypothetical protein